MADGQRIILIAADLMLASFASETARRYGFAVQTVDDIAALSAALSGSPPAAVIIDLQMAGLEIGPANKELRSRFGDVPVICYGRHTEPKMLRAARRAGCDVVVPRSSFIGELPGLLRSLPKAATEAAG